MHICEREFILLIFNLQSISCQILGNAKEAESLHIFTIRIQISIDSQKTDKQRNETIGIMKTGSSKNGHL